jgi:hypothetical protein
MSKLLKAILIFPVVLAVVYGVAVFISLEPDVRLWSEFGRLAFAALSLWGAWAVWMFS